MDANSMTPADRKLSLDSVSSRRFPQEGVIDLTSDPDRKLPDRKLALYSISSRRFPQEGVIDLTSDPDEVGPVSMEDDNTYIQDIPGVRSLGNERDCRHLAHTAPPKLQRFTPIATNSDLLQATKTLQFSTAENPDAPLVMGQMEPCVSSRKRKREADLLQVTKTLQFSTAENPVTPLVKGQMEPCVSSREIKREALTSLSSLNDRGSIGEEEKLKVLLLYKRLKKQVADHVEEKKEIKALNEKNVEEMKVLEEKLRKDLTEVNTEKETLIKSHSEEIEDLKTSFMIEKAKLEGGNTEEMQVLKEKLRKDLTDVNTEKETLIKSHSKEIEDLKTSFMIEKAKLEGGNEVYRDLLTEKNRLISEQNGEIEILKTSFSTLKLKVSMAFMEVETQNLSSNAETCGQSVQQ